jgi:hypothetical protein
LESNEATAKRPELFLIPAGVPPILGVQCTMDGEGVFSAIARPGRHAVRLFDRKRNEWLELGSVNVKENEEITVEYEAAKKIKFDQFEGF